MNNNFRYDFIRNAKAILNKITAVAPFNPLMKK